MSPPAGAPRSTSVPSAAMALSYAKALDAAAAWWWCAAAAAAAAPTSRAAAASACCPGSLHGRAQPRDARVRESARRVEETAKLGGEGDELVHESLGVLRPDAR